MQRSPTLFPPSQQRLHKLQFLKKLGCQKPYWDQATLSSLVNKQVVEIRSSCLSPNLATVHYSTLQYLEGSEGLLQVPSPQPRLQVQGWLLPEDQAATTDAPAGHTAKALAWETLLPVHNGLLLGLPILLCLPDLPVLPGLPGPLAFLSFLAFLDPFLMVQLAYQPSPRLTLKALYISFGGHIKENHFNIKCEILSTSSISHLS